MPVAGTFQPHIVVKYQPMDQIDQRWVVYVAVPFFFQLIIVKAGQKIMWFLY